MRKLHLAVALFCGLALASVANAGPKAVAKAVLIKAPKAALVTAPKAVASHQPVGGLIGSIIYIGGYAVDGVQAVTNAVDGGGPVTKKLNPLHYVNVVVNKVDDGFDAAEQFYGIAHQ